MGTPNRVTVLTMLIVAAAPPAMAPATSRAGAPAGSESHSGSRAATIIWGKKTMTMLWPAQPQ